MADDENIRITVRKKTSAPSMPKLSVPATSMQKPSGLPPEPSEPPPRIPSGQSGMDELERRALLKLRMYEQEHSKERPEPSPMRKRYFRIGCLMVSVLFSFLPLLFLQNCGGKEGIREIVIDQIQPPKNLQEEFEILGFGEKKPAPLPEPPAEQRPVKDEHDNLVPTSEPRPQAIRTPHNANPLEPLRLELKAKSTDVKDLYIAFKRILENTPCEGKNISLFLDLKQKFTDAGEEKNFLAWCRIWADDNPLSVPANRLAAEVLPDEKAVIYFRRVCINSLAAPEEEPYRRLIELYRKAGNWEKAAESGDSMMLAFPGNEWTARTCAEMRILRGADATREFQKLQSFAAKFTPEKRALFLLPTAIDFLPENISAELLAVPGLRKTDSAQFRRNLFRFALTFRREIPSAELAAPVQSEQERKLLLLYHVSHKEFIDAMNLPTPEREFPDFFKLFVYWHKKEFPDLRRTAKMFLEKHSSKSPAEILLCELWTEKRKLKDVRAEVEKISPPERSLLLLILMEEYRRAGNTRTARILREKLLRESSGIYSTLIDKYK